MTPSGSPGERERSMPVLSAIIPTRDRPELLADCLATLCQQDIGAGALEIVVIDDGSSSDLEVVVNALPASLATIRLVRQAPAGLTAARNRGAEVATGDFLAYLDDDTLVA